MKHKDIEDYIGIILQTNDASKENAEVPNTILMLIVYAAGLQQKPFPLHLVGKEDRLDIEKELPIQFHELVAQLAIKKSKIEQTSKNFAILRYNFFSMKTPNLLEKFRRYFIQLY